MLRCRYTLKTITGPVLGLFLSMFTLTGAAQTDGLEVRQTAEYDIGFDCPVSAALDSTGTRLWVLMDNCYGSRFSLRAFGVADGAPLNDDTSDFSDELEVMDKTYVSHFTFPLAFTPDGMLDILYSDSETYDTLNLRLPVESTAEAADTRALLPTFDALNTLIPGFAGYPETTVYNGDHTLAAVMDETHVHILDLQTGVRLFEIKTVEPYNAFPYFSADNQTLYIAELHNFDDVTDYSSTLKLYSLPDGEQIASYEVPSPFLWVSPNEQYLAMQVGDETLQVLDLVSGSLSAALPLFEPPQKVMRCLNNGNDVSDVDFTTRGDLFLMGLNWLPDSSGFLTVQSYLGDGAQGGTICIFNYSRLRRYAVEDND